MAASKPGASDPAVTSATASSVGDDNSNGLILSVQDVIEKLKIRREHFSAKLKDAHPKMKDLSDQIESEQKFLERLKARSQTVRDAYQEELKLRMQNLQQQISSWSAKSLDLSQRLGIYRELQNKTAREKGLYNQLSAQIQSVDLNQSLGQEEVVIMEAASPPRPLNHNYLLRLLYGVAGGVVVGGAIIFLLIRLDGQNQLADRHRGKHRLPARRRNPARPARQEIEARAVADRG